MRALRGVTSPNIGFTCQLLQWQVGVHGAWPERLQQMRTLLPAPDWTPGMHVAA